MPNYRKLANKQDKLVSSETGFHIQINSGAVRGRKGDLFDKRTLIETKTCEKPQRSFSIQKAWLDKLATQAFSMGKELGILVFSFGTRDQYGVLPLSQLMNMYNSVLDYEDLVNQLQAKLAEYEGREYHED